MGVEQAAADILRTIRHGTNGAAPAQRLVDECARATRSAGASLTWAGTKAASLTIAATAGAGHDLDLVGHILGEGPQVSCADTNRAVLRPFLDGGSAEWPGFTPEALRAGVKAVFAFPLRIGAISLGALTIYRHEPGSLSEERLTTVLAYVAAATVLLLDTSTTTSAGDDAVDRLPAVLEDPFALQADVHQATGMLSAQLDTDLQTALSLLRAHAYSTSAPLTVVARAVIDRELLITWDTDGLPGLDERERA